MLSATRIASKAIFARSPSKPEPVKKRDTRALERLLEKQVIVGGENFHWVFASRAADPRHELGVRRRTIVKRLVDDRSDLLANGFAQLFVSFPVEVMNLRLANYTTQAAHPRQDCFDVRGFKFGTYGASRVLPYSAFSATITMSVRPATAGISGLLLPGGKMPAGAPAPTKMPIRLRPWAMICRRLAMYWSGLWTLAVVERSLV